jgi:hypothetical protein
MDIKGWQKKDTVKKGNIGESIVDEYLKSKGFEVYEPITSNAHGFDRLVSKGKDSFMVVEVKTKAKRNYYPDTGIDYRHYLEYRHISNKHNLPVWIFFVDEMERKVYAGLLSEMEINNCYNYNGKLLSYPKVEGDSRKIIYFYQPNLKHIKDLTNNEVEQIKSYSTRKHTYLKNGQRA